MKNDFTTVAGTWPGSNIVECGASESVSGNPATWHFHIGAMFDSGTTLPCPRATIVSDGGQQALQIKYLATDPQIGSGGQAGTGLIWPYWGSKNPPQSWMPNVFYGKLIFRLDAQTVYQGGNGDFEWWTTSGQNSQATWVDLNLGESNAGSLNQSNGMAQWGGGYWEWCCSGNNNLFGPPNEPIIDFTVYHTFEYLFTNNGSDNAMCQWIDGGSQGCGHGTFVNGSNYSEHDRIFNLAMGMNFAHNAIANDATMWIRDYEVWSCSSFASGTCAASNLFNSGGLYYYH